MATIMVVWAMALVAWAVVMATIQVWAVVMITMDMATTIHATMEDTGPQASAEKPCTPPCM